MKIRLPTKYENLKMSFSVLERKSVKILTYLLGSQDAIIRQEAGTCALSVSQQKFQYPALSVIPVGWP